MANVAATPLCCPTLHHETSSILIDASKASESVASFVANELHVVGPLNSESENGFETLGGRFG